MSKTIGLLVIATLACGGGGGGGSAADGGGAGTAGHGGAIGGGMAGSGVAGSGGSGTDAGLADGRVRDWSQVDALLLAAAADGGAVSFGLTVWDQGDQRIYERMLGGFTPDTRVAI